MLYQTSPNASLNLYGPPTARADRSDGRYGGALQAGLNMVPLGRCPRCDHMRQHVLVARLMEPVAGAWHCGDCGAAIVPIRLTSAAVPFKEIGGLSPTHCPCIDGGPVTRATTVLQPMRILWLCGTCGLGRWPRLAEPTGRRTERLCASCPSCGSEKTGCSLRTYWASYCRCTDCGHTWQENHPAGEALEKGTRASD